MLEWEQKLAKVALALAQLAEAFEYTRAMFAAYAEEVRRDRLSE